MNWYKMSKKNIFIRSLGWSMVTVVRDGAGNFKEDN